MVGNLFAVSIAPVVYPYWWILLIKEDVLFKGGSNYIQLLLYLYQHQICCLIATPLMI
jgi:hypothetical protein